MKLIITQPEIEAIVRAHVLNTVQLRDGAEIKIDFVATRGDDGITATIDIPYLGVAGIPAITDAAKEAAPAKEPSTPTPAKASGRKGSILGTPKPPVDPEPAAAAPADDKAPFPEAETASDSNQEAAGEATTPTDEAAEPVGEEAAQEASGEAEAAATTRGPSLFGSFRAG